MLGEALDRDPFLLFELRGRGNDQVLDALRAARGGPSETSKKKSGKVKATSAGEPDEIPTVKLGKLKESDYDKLREPLPVLHFRFVEPVSHGALLGQLGPLPTWDSDASPADVLTPLVRAAAANARQIALRESSDAAPAPTARLDRTVRKGTTRRKPPQP